MTTSRANAVPPANPLWRRLSHTWRILFAPGDMTVLLVAAGLLVMPALALNGAGWPLTLRTLLPVVVLSVIFGFLLARSHYNELFALMISTIYGGSFVLLFAALSEPGGLGQGVYNVFTRTIRWLVDATSGGINQDDLVFTLLVSMLFWFLGYNAAWHIFRVDRVWRVVLPPGLILATNSIFYEGEANLDLYIIVFLFLALLLIARSNLDAREWEWYVNGIRVPRTLRHQFLRVGAALALVSLLLAWGIPSGDLQERLNKFQEFLRNDPLSQLTEFWNRLFSPIDTQGPATADYYGADSLELGGAIRLGKQPVFTVSAPPIFRYYWRSRVFDSYVNGRWSTLADKRLSTPSSPFEAVYEVDAMGGRTPVEQVFMMELNASRLVYTAPQPFRVELSTRTDLRYTDSAERYMNISVIRPTRVIYRGDSYSATSLLSTAAANDLRAASTAYPDWIRRYYTDSPENPLYVTQATRDLAVQIVNEAGAATPYDQAKAVEKWLRANIVYNESIPQPPSGVNQVDWVLFDLKQGYCEYYASAMIVMLRSLGIPARMAAGFAQGTYDTEKQQYVVLERDAHTWVEVYFPGFGWVEFEPTAAQAELKRAGDEETPQFPTPIPATPSPSATFTPQPSPSPTSQATEPTPLQQQDPVIPTITPTPSPTPTATPVIVPTQPPPVRPPARSFLSILLPAIGLALLGLLLIVLLVGGAVFIWWWWEWRGMRGLSPVTRAYAKLERFVSLIGVRLGAQQTPEERRRYILRNLPGAERPVTAITRMYTNERYGPGPKHPAEAANNAQIADKAWLDTRRTILQRFMRRFMPWKR